VKARLIVPIGRRRRPVSKAGRSRTSGAQGKPGGVVDPRFADAYSCTRGIYWHMPSRVDRDQRERRHGRARPGRRMANHDDSDQASRVPYVFFTTLNRASLRRQNASRRISDRAYNSTQLS
jgi:hypothetical protein